MSKEDIYDNEIASLVAKIVECCKKNNIASFMHFYLDDELRVTAALPVSEDESHNQSIDALTKEVYIAS